MNDQSDAQAPRKVAVFDVDDTSWPMKAWFVFWYLNNILGGGITSADAEAYALEQLVSVKLEESFPGMTPEQADALVRSFYQWLNFEGSNLDPVDGFERVVQALTDTGVILKFATGNQHVPGEAITSWANWRAQRVDPPAFTGCVNTGLFGSKVEALHRIAEEAGAAMEDVVHVDDQYVTAKLLADAGFRVVLIQWGYPWGHMPEPHPRIIPVPNMQSALPAIRQALRLPS